jgi:hypothetical protein
MSAIKIMCSVSIFYQEKKPDQNPFNLSQQQELKQ